ncbi:TniB family NTP-binding protein [Burkholderia cepacia]|uniref:TniB family NTP-binding protein n=1 Tax=Burkholderia cepacia TaxID=292 RepID=UPI001FC884B8|nr:TniB family NTP-binding protein [Burkholderia cepacia]
MRVYRPGNQALTDFVFYLVARIVASGTVHAERLWTWLAPFDASVGYQNQQRLKLDEMIREDTALRRAIQRIVLLERTANDEIAWRVWELRRRSPSLVPTADDIIALLAVLDSSDFSDERLRALVVLVSHDGEVGSEVRAAAARFATHRPELIEWLDQLSEPRIPRWQIDDEERQRERRAIMAGQHAEHRKVLVGTRDAVLGLQTDSLMISRYRPFEIPRWRESESLRRLMAAFEC